MLAEARADVVHADQKASLVLAALGIGFAAVLAGQLNGTFDPSRFSIWGAVLWWIGVAAASTSVVLAGLAVWPRFRVDDSPRYGITYWGHIAAFRDLPELEAALDEQDATSSKRTRHQLWRLSILVHQKYSFVRAALAAAAVSVPLLVLGGMLVR
jgi:hypothetical protein